LLCAGRSGVGLTDRPERPAVEGLIERPFSRHEATLRRINSTRKNNMDIFYFSDIYAYPDILSAAAAPECPFDHLITLAPPKAKKVLIKGSKSLCDETFAAQQQIPSS